MISRRDWCKAALAAGTWPGAAGAQQKTPQSIDDFFRDFTEEWLRQNPELATRARYFKGAEQDALERQLSPLTLAHRLEVIESARKGLARLGKFDRARLTEPQRVSAATMEWQLGEIVQEEKFLDYSFPLE